MVTSPLARLWTDRCDIVVRRGEADPESGRTVFTEQVLCADVPCRVSFRLSFETVSAVKDAGGAATAAGQSVKLFLPPDIPVPAGSKIIVRGRGREMVFARSGQPAVFDRHQEVRLERFGTWT